MSSDHARYGPARRPEAIREPLAKNYDLIDPAGAYIAWQQLSDSRIKASCNACVMGPKDEGCNFCGYDAFVG